MTTPEILQYLQREIHTAVFATLDAQGLPQTCVIDLMLADAGGLYFLTARGKAFHARLTARPFVALSGMRGADTLSSVAVSLRGAVRNIGQTRLDEIFAQNPYMEKIYPTRASRAALEVFQIYRGTGEYFDLSQLPPFRQTFAFGGETPAEAGYRIDPSKCTGCSQCLSVCPTGCIRDTTPRTLDARHCLHCGNCLRVCPAGAVIHQG